MIARLSTLTLVAALIFPVPSLAQSVPETPRIVVSGTGQAAAAPDLAVLQLSVMREAETARAALDENSKAMADVINAMKEAGIEDRDLQTSGFAISPRYVYPKDNSGDQQPKIVAYQVTNTLTVRVRDLQSVGAILDTSVTLGVNQGGNITFGNAEPAPILDQARKEAVANAIAKARTLAEAAGVKTGTIMEISEVTQMDRPVPMMSAVRMEAADAGVPVQAGESTYSVTVNITFAIDQ